MFLNCNSLICFTDTPVQECTPAVSSGATDDVFSSFLSAPAAAVQNSISAVNTGVSSSAGLGQRSAEEENFFNQPQSSPATNKLTTDSILALYGKSQPAPTPSNAFPLQGN